MDRIDDQIYKETKPFKFCPLCGDNLITKTSFKGRTQYRNKRMTQICTCGWSCILPTDREAETQLGLI